jgi:hypothetical protein
VIDVSIALLYLNIRKAPKKIFFGWQQQYSGSSDPTKKNILKTSDIHLPVSIYMTAVVSCVHSADIVI